MQVGKNDITSGTTEWNSARVGFNPGRASENKPGISRRNRFFRKITTIIFSRNLSECV
jgi:hypothetical protein